MNNNTSISLLEFAWSSLTDNQRYYINIKYELKQALDNRGDKTKVSVYKAVSDKHQFYTIQRLKDIDLKDLNK